ncbi:MAG: TlpA disulfide reductase family protein [Bacteroidota bacterium]
MNYRLRLAACTFLCMLLVSFGIAQEANFPNVDIRNLENGPVQSSDILNPEGFTVISFWATWCKPCIRELNNINDLYEEWTEEVNVKVVAVSIDDARSSSKVGVFVNSKNWPFDVYLDVNSDLKRALNINNIPHSIVVDKNGKIVREHSGYLPGDEYELYDELVELQEKQAEN